MTRTARSERYWLLVAEVEKLFPEGKIAELATCIARGPGFRDAEQRMRLPGRVRSWALQHIPHEHDDYPRPLSEILQTDAAKSQQDLNRIKVLASELRQLLGNLPPSGRKALEIIVDNNLGRGPQGRPYALTEPLLGLLAALEAMAPSAATLVGLCVLKHRPPRYRLKAAILDLGVIWCNSTGKKPTVTIKDAVLCGPFPVFVRVALEPLWPPNARQSVDSLIRHACTELGRLGWT